MAKHSRTGKKKNLKSTLCLVALYSTCAQGTGCSDPVATHAGTGKFSKVLSIWWLYALYSKYTRALTFRVLWQTTLGQAPPPTPCPRCLAPRCFEAQVIPALLYLLIYMYVHILYKYTHVCVRIYICRCMYVCIYIHTRYVLIRPPIPYITSLRCKRLHKVRP